MSNTKTAAMQHGPSITTTGKRKIAAKDKSPFTIDGHTYQLIRPKAALLGQAAGLLDPTHAWNESENARVLLQYTSYLIAYVQETPPDKDSGAPTGRAKLQQRLSDPMDDLDLFQLVPLFTELLQGWLGDEQERPTGSPRASAPRRPASRTGGSRARTR